jgi:PTH1 family peptidyl-tRNA hydrolase
VLDTGAQGILTTKLYQSVETVIAGKRVLLAAPMTYMNLSGDAVAALAGEHGLAPSQFLVVCDDIALPLGTLRIRRRGSSGGQNGLSSIIETLGTDAVPRVRCGIGTVPPGISAADYVLGRFLPEEREAAEALVLRAAEAVCAIVEEGFDVAMNRFNNNPE